MAYQYQIYFVYIYISFLIYLIILKAISWNHEKLLDLFVVILVYQLINFDMRKGC